MSGTEGRFGSKNIYYFRALLKFPPHNTSCCFPFFSKCYLKFKAKTERKQMTSDDNKRPWGEQYP
jgi:hypothetical protein